MTRERRLRTGIYLLCAGGGLALVAAGVPVLLAGGSPGRTNVLSTYLVLGGLLLLGSALVSLPGPQPLLTLTLSGAGVLLVAWAGLGAFAATNFVPIFERAAGCARKGCGMTIQFSQPELAAFTALQWMAVVAVVLAVAGFWVFYRAARRLDR